MTTLQNDSVQNDGLALDGDLLKACIHCGMCLPVCPTYQVSGSEAESPRGRLYLMRQWQGGTLTGEAVSPHLEKCLGCQACQTACPSGVQYGNLLFQSREKIARKTHSPGRWLKRLIFRWVLPNPLLLHGLGDILKGYQQLPLSRWVRQSGLLNFLGLSHQEALLPQIPARRPLEAGMAFGNPSHPKVALMLGCVMDVFYNPIHLATVEVMVANGYYVVIPSQTCCGALAHHAGESDIALILARQNVTSVMALQPDWIVLNSAGCGATMKEYAHLLSDEKDLLTQAQGFSEKVVDILALLAKKPLAKMPVSLPINATYHPPCHLHHAQGIKIEPLAVLSQIPGLKLVPLPDAETCCGSAGIYNVEQPELSREILANKVDNLAKTGAEWAITGNPGCLMQLVAGVAERGLPMAVKHPVEVLAMAYGVWDDGLTGDDDDDVMTDENEWAP